jgi:hypothetical protein
MIHYLLAQAPAAALQAGFGAIPVGSGIAGLVLLRGSIGIAYELGRRRRS